MPAESETMKSQTESDNGWKELYRAGGIAALFAEAILPVQMVVLMVGVLDAEGGRSRVRSRDA